MTTPNMYSENVSTNDLVEYNLYSYNNKEVIYENFCERTNKHIFIGHDDIYHFVEPNDENVKIISKRRNN